MGIRAARHAAQVAINSIENDDFSSVAMASYETAWKKDFGHEIMRGLQLFKIRQKISQKDMDQEVTASTGSMIKSAVFSQIIILIVYLPILSLEGIEGKIMGINFSKTREHETHKDEKDAKMEQRNIMNKQRRYAKKR